MALDEKKLADQQKVDEQERTDQKRLAEGRKLTKARGRGYGLGLLKGMAVTLKHLFKHNTVIQYPDEKQDLPSRTRGVIALKEENCTVCMLCARECPDWCIYIDSHKEQLPPKREGGRPRKRNVLDRFAIDYALCMYCGICVEVCPYDALFWSREFEYSEYDIRELTHEKEKLSDWMATVLPPPELEIGAEVPGQPAASGSAAPAGAAAPAPGQPVATGGAGPGSAQRPAPPAAATAAAERPEQAQRQPAAAATAAPSQDAATVSQEEAGEVDAPHAEGRDQATEEKAPAGEGKPQAGTATGTDGAQPEAIKSETEAKSPDQLERPEHDKAATTTEPQRETGTEAAAVEAGGDRRTTPGTPAQTTPEDESVQDKGESAPAPKGAASAEGDGAAEELSAAERSKFQESPGPNVEVPQETPQPVALQPTEDADAVYRQVLQEQLDKGSSPQVAEARAKVARAKAARGIKRGPTPIQTEKMVPSAPTKGQPTPQEPSGAPEAKDVAPDPGPVAPAAGDTSESAPPPEKPQENAAAHTAPPEATQDAASTASATESGGDAEAQPQAADAGPGSPAASEDAGSTDATPPTAAGQTGGVAEASAPAEKAGQPEPGAPAAATVASGDDPDAVYESVLAEEKAKGSSDAVAMGRAKAARVKAERAQKKAGG